MHKIILILLFVIFSAGCGNNPFEPSADKYTSFYGFLNDMDSHNKVSSWMKANAEYDLKFYDSKIVLGDLVKQYALYIFVKKRGACMQYACLQIYAARWHKKECGMIVEINKETNNSHAKAWIKEKDGSISITTDDLSWSKMYSSKQAMIDYYETSFKNHYSIFDDELKEVISANLNIMVR